MNQNVKSGHFDIVAFYFDEENSRKLLILFTCATAFNQHFLN